MTELLWMDEDELRAVCEQLIARLRSSDAVMKLMLHRATDDAYRAGYCAAVMGIAQETETGDAGGYLLH